METQTGLDWIEQEEQTLGITAPATYEKLPGMKFEENKITQVLVDLGKRWETYADSKTDVGKVKVKAIIPVAHEGVRKIWWLNKANPVFQKLIAKAKTELMAGKTAMTVKVVRTGVQNATRYALVE